MAIVSVPYLYVLWGLWTGTINPFRAVGPSNFYELQARAIAHGHLYIPQGKLGVEAFLHGGHAYTYFGIFPSLLRVPIIALLPALEGRMTAPFLLFTWLLTGLFSALLIWRVRILVGTSRVMGWTEAASFGVLVAVITGGSVLVFLAANPWVYNEDLAWGAALATGALFTLLGVMEKPSWGRVIASGLLILAADLSRLTTGWACVIAAVLVAGWFALGKGGADNRRWWLPILAAGLIPLLVGCAINWMKFGGPFTLPVANQVWTQINAHRRHFLAVNGGDFTPRFLPSTVFAYLQPAGLKFSALFPFITLPDAPARTFGVLFDETYPTASIPASMPLLFLLSIWGVVTAFRPRPIGNISWTRILLLAALAGTVGVLVVGYIADRYLADFLPFLILASVIGLVDIWRRASAWKPRPRLLLTIATVLLGVFCVVANVGIALESMNVWSSPQATRFVEAQKALSIEALSSTVKRGPTLPYWAPTGQIFNVNSCSGLYLSSGVDYSTSPGQQKQHATWTPLEQDSNINHVVAVTVNKPVSQIKGSTPILKFGRATVYVRPASFNTLQVVVKDAGGGVPAWPPPLSPPFVVKLHKSNLLTVMTDPYLHSVQVRDLEIQHIGGSLATLRPGIRQGILLFDHYLAGPGRAQVISTPHGTTQSMPGLSVGEVPTTRSTTSLCRSLRPAG